MGKIGNKKTKEKGLVGESNISGFTDNLEEAKLKAE